MPSCPSPHLDQWNGKGNSELVAWVGMCGPAIHQTGDITELICNTSGQNGNQEESSPLLHCWWECKLVQPLWRTVWRFLRKLEIELPYDPAIPLLGIHTEETSFERDTGNPLFIAALFITARTWKQPRCPSADEWIRKLWYIYTMEYYSAIKKNSFESILMRWMKLDPIIQSEVSQKDKHQYSILTHIYGILKDGNDNPICKTEKETQMYRTDFWTLWEKARVG